MMFMSRFRQVAQIQELMSNKEAVRNIGIIAHIDHGKTTLADCLLSGAGMLASSMAGTARVLDYLEEEQKRKITIKTANISLLYKNFQDNNIVINLIDTPGHVDFTGKVTRALRVIDGAVVVVDAVEGVMAQTEIVTQQALKERVYPVLFINKVDRLITELQLSEEQIQERLDSIINSFNDLIEVYSEPPYNTVWKITPKKGNVAFGAALHGWGFTVDMAKQKAVKFQDVIAAYQQQDVEKLKKIFPVHRAILDMAVNVLPNPCQAQAYRVETLLSAPVSSKIGCAVVECRDDGPVVMYVTNVSASGEGGCIATGRVFSGKVCKGDRVRLVNSSVDIEISDVYVDMGFFREKVSEVHAGFLASVSLPLMVKVGETICDLSCNEELSPFEGVCYISEPVVTIAVEPKNPQQTAELFMALEGLASEDPNLHVTAHKETGEYLLSGMGELHLEVAINNLKRNCGLEITVSSPRVVYMESITRQGVIAQIKIANRHQQHVKREEERMCSFSIQVEPEQERQKLTIEEMDRLLYSDMNGNIFVDFSGKMEDASKEFVRALINGFEYACNAGPLCSEPIRRVKVKIIGIQQSVLDQNSLNDVTHGVGKAVFASFLTAKPVLLEPIYAITISVSSEVASECSKILATHRGKNKSFEQQSLRAIIKGFIPVAETFCFSKELRSATSGRAVWQSLFSHWEELPEKYAGQIISERRRQKGLSEDVPSPEKFLEGSI
ncbi:MAG: GTP-binding protein [Candidatus Bathyarchaeota archaeon]|nr:GTP-binding protein [Candidatus Termiticorpusculum sp.]MCL1970531.1 GTP-binding protein [Candidatus Termiticorpusculum sp.]